MLQDKDGNIVYCLACTCSFEHHIELVGTSVYALSQGCTGWFDPRLQTEIVDAVDEWEPE